MWDLRVGHHTSLFVLFVSAHLVSDRGHDVSCGATVRGSDRDLAVRTAFGDLLTHVPGRAAGSKALRGRGGRGCTGLGWRERERAERAEEGG